MVINSKHCEAQKIKPNLVSNCILQVYIIMYNYILYMYNLAGQNSNNIVKNRVDVEKA